MFKHIKKDLSEKQNVARASKKQLEKNTTATIQKHIESLIGEGVVERVNMNGDTLVLLCSGSVAASRARMYTKEIQEKTGKKRIFFLS